MNSTFERKTHGATHFFFFGTTNPNRAAFSSHVHRHADTPRVFVAPLPVAASTASTTTV